MSQSNKYAVVSAAEASRSPYPYVFVNEDRTVRELHEAEQKYLEEEFSPMDGGRPYVKGGFAKCDGWGSLAGFCRRSDVPAELLVAPAPADDPNLPMSKEEQIAWLKKKMVGFDVVERSYGTVECNRKNAPGRIANHPLQRTGAAGLVSKVRKWFGRGPGR